MLERSLSQPSGSTAHRVGDGSPLHVDGVAVRSQSANITDAFLTRLRDAEECSPSSGLESTVAEQLRAAAALDDMLLDHVADAAETAANQTSAVLPL